MKAYVDIPPCWLLLAAALAWWQASYLPIGPSPSVLVRGFGGLFVALGVAVIVAAALEFLRHRTTIIPHQTPMRIIENGVFGISRNPIYLGDAMILLGLILRWGAWPSLILVPLFVWWIERHFVGPEEDRMRQKFGGDFLRYERNVRRWIYPF